MASSVPASAPIADKKKTDPLLLSGFERLSKLVYLYRPGPPVKPPAGRSPSAVAANGSSSLTSSPASSSTSSRSPNLILIGGWMDAREAHLAKYTSQYQALFPGTPILLVRSFAYHFTPGRRARRLALDVEPAVPVIQSAATPSSSGSVDEHDDDAADPAVLVHVFSNGGSTILRHLYALCRTVPFPPHVTIFDSAPGRFQFSRSVYAFSLGVPYARTPFLRFLAARLAIYLLCATYWLLVVALRRRGALERTYASHNDPSLNRNEVRRTYFYSREDRMVDARDVEEHAAEAGRRGVVRGRVRLERFEGTAHVAHVRGGEEQYWRIVKESWEGDRS